MKLQLPQPGPGELEKSQQLLDVLRNQISEVGGWIPFSDYMRQVLYTPGLGYYSGGSNPFGAIGDFVTAPEISPLFGACISETIAQVLASKVLSGKGLVLEVGAGTGRLAVQVLKSLAMHSLLPSQYVILELSRELQQFQRALIEKETPELAHRVTWLTRLPQDFQGVIIGNEVLDAMPCALVYHSNQGWKERGLIWKKGLAWEDRSIQDARIRAQAQAIPISGEYLTEIHLEAQGFIASLAECLTAGAILLVDYGFGSREYYHPQRNMGTLMCHYHHYSHMDPLWMPGINDISTHIDFSAIYRAGSYSGLQLEGYLTQCAYLINAGLPDKLEKIETENEQMHYAALSAVQKLIIPSEMGTLFKVIAFSKQLYLPHSLWGFQTGDDSSKL